MPFPIISNYLYIYEDLSTAELGVLQFTDKVPGEDYKTLLYSADMSCVELGRIRNV